MRRKKRLTILGLIVAAIIIDVVAMVVISNINKKNEEKISGLISNISEYAQLKTTGTGTLDDLQKPVKIFIICNEYGEKKVSSKIVYSKLMFKIDEKLRAYKPDEMNTLVRLDYSYNEIFIYNNGDKGISADLKVTVIDMSSKKILDEQEFYDSPANVKRTDGDEYGDFMWPNQQVVDYLNSLDR